VLGEQGVQDITLARTIVLHSLFTCTPRTPKTEFYVKQGQIYGKFLCFG
jgi:hypothetical protein